MEKVKLGDTHYGPKYAFITFKQIVSVPYTLQLMNGIRLYDQPLCLKRHNSSGTTGHAGGPVQTVPSHQPMGPPSSMPPNLFMPSPAIMHRSSSSVNHNISGGHAGLLRSSSEPERLGSNWHENRRTGNTAPGREREAGPYSRPHVHERASQRTAAENIASHLHMLNRASIQQKPQFDMRHSHSSPYRQQNHRNQFNAYGGFRRR